MTDAFAKREELSAQLANAQLETLGESSHVWIVDIGEFVDKEQKSWNLAGRFTTCRALLRSVRSSFAAWHGKTPNNSRSHSRRSSLKPTGPARCWNTKPGLIRKSRRMA
jgi:hypothetical protein